MGKSIAPIRCDLVTLFVIVNSPSDVAAAYMMNPSNPEKYTIRTVRPISTRADIF